MVNPPSYLALYSICFILPCKAEVQSHFKTLSHIKGFIPQSSHSSCHEHSVPFHKSLCIPSFHKSLLHKAAIPHATSTQSHSTKTSFHKSLCISFHKSPFHNGPFISRAPSYSMNDLPCTIILISNTPSHRP